MGRMKGVASTRLVAVPSRFGPVPFATEADRSKYRRAVNPWRDWYSDPEWRALRRQVLIEEDFTCRMCGRKEIVDTSLLVGDHIKPHKGDRALFQHSANVQCLCKTSHGSK